VSLRDRLVDIDARVGVPRDADEAFLQNTRYWWVGLALSVVILVLLLIAVAVGWVGVAGVAVFVPFLAFASGYYYAQRLAVLGRRSSLLDRRSDAPPA
jgi:hypothetical protein